MFTFPNGGHHLGHTLNSRSGRVPVCLAEDEEAAEIVNVDGTWPSNEPAETVANLLDDGIYNRPHPMKPQPIRSLVNKGGNPRLISPRLHLIPSFAVDE